MTDLTMTTAAVAATSSQNMKLKRVLGFTSNGRNSSICNPANGNLIYIAGCVIVIFDPVTKTQEHLYTDSKQTITTLAITVDGNYLASADCGNQASIHVWDLTSRTLISEFTSYNVEVFCLSFSTDRQILVSSGYQDEMNINVWDWRRKLRVSSHKVATKVRALSFATDDSYFITVGDAYVKYWYIHYDQQGFNNPSPNPPVMVSGSRTATLGEQKKNNFCGVGCGKGVMSGSMFCITKTGLLCELDNRRLLHKWVDLKTPCAYSLAVGENLIVIGCSNGVVRCFNTTELRFLRNLPRPHALGIDISNSNCNTKKDNNTTLRNSIYPSAISVNLDEKSNTISCIYNDRSIYVWDLSEPTRTIKRYSVLYHNSCIWGIDIYPDMRTRSTNPQLPNGSFVTCSSDDTIRIWNPNVFSSKLKCSRKKLSSTTGASTSLYKESQYSDELLKIIFTDASYKFLCDSESSDMSKVNEDYDNSEGLRCLRISPNGNQLAVGSRSGAIRIFDFGEDKEIKNIAAHDAEVLCLEYSDPSKYNGYCYLASSSRDKLIHIFNVADNYTFLQTIDDHLSSITALRFVNNRARDCLQLVSCGADSRLVFRNGVKVNGSHLNFVPDQHIEGKHTFYDMEVDIESSCLMTACQDRMIRLFNVAKGKYQSGFKGSSSDEGTLIKIALDPSCTFLATSSTDKSINLYDYQRGERIGSIIKGLSDLVTDLKFSPNGKYLIACTGDGCIFIWKCPAEIVNAIKGETTQHSLSTCSLGSFNDRQSNYHEINNSLSSSNKKRNQIDDKTTNVRLQSLPDWAKQQMLNELERNSQGKQELSHSLNRRPSSDETSYDELNISNKQRRYQVQDATHTSDNESDYTNLNKLKSSPTTTYGYNSIEDARYLSHMSTGNRFERSKTGDVNKHPTRKAKLFQSRENLDRISSREKYVVESLVHTGKTVNRNTNYLSSSLSGKFNTVQDIDVSSELKTSNLSESHLMGTVGNEEDIDIDSNGIYAELNCESLAPEKQNQCDSESKPMNVYDSTNLNKGQYTQKQRSFPSNRLRSGSDGRLSQSMHILEGSNARQFDSSDEELSLSGERRHLMNLSVNSQLPTVVPKTISLGEQTEKSAAVPQMYSTYEIIGSRTSDITQGLRAMRPKTVGRKLNQFLSEERNISSIKSSRSECNLLLDDSHRHEKTIANSERDNLIYCRKLDLTKINPADSLISKEFCQYIVDELQAISKYATRLHQTLQRNEDRRLCSMIARGVQNSMDILSIVPPRTMSRQRYQSQLNLSPVSLASNRHQIDYQSNTPLTDKSSQLDHQITSSAKKRGTTNYHAHQDGSKTLSSSDRRRERSVDRLVGEQVKATNHGSSKNNLLNLDQVLEAYSDRLFRMVQERMVEQQQPDKVSSSETVKQPEVSKSKT